MTSNGNVIVQNVITNTLVLVIVSSGHVKYKRRAAQKRYRNRPAHNCQKVKNNLHVSDYVVGMKGGEGWTS